MQGQLQLQWLYSYPLILIILAIICNLHITEQAFGFSPAFGVRKITDEMSDWIDINKIGVRRSVY
jgi:hypothetical protein